MTDSIENISSRFNTFDRLLIKVQFRDDIRKLFFPNANLTVNTLISLIKDIFNGKISKSDQLVLKYLDNDGDQVTLANDVDLVVALNFHQKLRLFVYLDGDKSTTKTVGDELKQIRDTVQMILDRCQSVEEKETPVAPISSPLIRPTTLQESDPHSHLLQRQRSNTPNTLRSRILHANRRYPTESTEAKTPPISPFPSAPHLIPSGFNNQLTPTTPTSINPNIPLYATRAFPSSRHSNLNVSPSNSTPVSTFIGQQFVSNTPIHSPLAPPPPTATNFFTPKS